MALILRGNGVVEGLTDLPAGSVTAADLASGAITSGALPAGSVLQVVSNTIHSTISTTSTDVVATNHTVTLTPSNISSKVLLMIHGGNCWSSDSSFGGMLLRFYRSINGGSYTALGDNWHGFRENLSGGAITKGSIGASYLDSPSSTSALTYQAYFKRNSDAGTAYYNEATLGITITAMEVAG